MPVQTGAVRIKLNGYSDDLMRRFTDVEYERCRDEIADQVEREQKMNPKYYMGGKLAKRGEFAKDLLTEVDRRCRAAGLVTWPDRTINSVRLMRDFMLDMWR